MGRAEGLLRNSQLNYSSNHRRNDNLISSQIIKVSVSLTRIYEKNDFAKRSKILLDTDLKIILLDHQNNFVGTLKVMSNAAKNFDILATSLSVLYNYFGNSTKLLF